MSATISVLRQELLSITETFSDADPGNPDVLFTTLNQALVTYTANTTVPVVKFSCGEKALASGTGTLRMTALPGRKADEIVDGTGLKVQFFWCKNKSTNANNISFTFGASNPYNLMGSDYKVTLAPGQSNKFEGNDATPDVASGAKDIDLAGTLAQVLQYVIVLG